MNDSERQAAAIKASISTYVATAALAVLAGALALFTWISQTFVPPWTFYGCMAVAVVFLVIAIFVGGLGQDWLVNEVAHDRWNNPPTWQFNWQSGLTLVALCFVTAATAIGATSVRSSPDSSPTTDAKLRTIDRDLRAIDRTVASDITLRSDVTNLQKQLENLTLRVEADESEGPSR
jgi:hypothetical protein